MPVKILKKNQSDNCNTPDDDVAFLKFFFPKIHKNIDFLKEGFEILSKKLRHIIHNYTQRLSGRPEAKVLMKHLLSWDFE